MMDPTVAFLVAILFIAPIYWILYVYPKRKKFYEALEPYSGDSWYPIIGTTLRFVKLKKREERYDQILDRCKEFRPIFRSWIGFQPAVHLMRAHQIEPVLSSSENIRKGRLMSFFEAWLGEGLISCPEVHKWRHHRKIITPTFHFTILDKMTEVFCEKSELLTQMLTEKADGTFLDVYPYLTHCQLDIICETAMGVKINATSYSDSEYVKAIYSILDTIYYRIVHPYAHSDFIFALSSKGREQKKSLSILHSFTRKVIQDRKEAFNKETPSTGQTRNQAQSEDELLGKKKRLAFLDLLLELNEKQGSGLTDEEIREEVDTFMFAGHDTSTAAICWTLFVLGNYPEVQDKVYEELESIFHGEERPVTPQDVAQMQYLDRVLKETLRVIPVIPSIFRRLDKDVVVDGRVIPAGVMVVIHIHELHKDPHYFPDPERFDPDRFLPENTRDRHPFAYVPFSAGPRNCLGQKFATRNSKVMLATILRKLRVKSLKRLDQMKYYCEIVLRPKDGLELAFEPRKKSH